MVSLLLSTEVFSLSRSTGASMNAAAFLFGSVGTFSISMVVVCWWFTGVSDSDT